MRPSLRFLGLALVGWVGVRGAMLGALPGADVFTIRQLAAAPAPSVMAGQPEIIPIPPADPEAAAMMQAAMPGQLDEAVVVPAQPVARPVEPAPRMVAAAAFVRPARYAPRRPRYRQSIPFVEAAAPYHYMPWATMAPYPSPDEYPVSRAAAAAYPPLGTPVHTAAAASATALPQRSVPAIVAAAPEKIDRLQLTAWAMLRGRTGLQSAPSSLASSGTLGASQAGARLTYAVRKGVEASLRTTNTVGKRGGEVALGARIQPVQGIPVWVTAERRQAIGKYGGGRSAFALFFEGGLWNRKLPGKFRLDAYLQGGVVGFRKRDGFIDGAVTATRPVYRNFSAGLGVWGAAQPGVARLDAGPRVTMKVRDNVVVHMDYRQKLAGNAQPGSGPVITLAGDF